VSTNEQKGQHSTGIGTGKIMFVLFFKQFNGKYCGLWSISNTYLIQNRIVDEVVIDNIFDRKLRYVRFVRFPEISEG
jgi:hypothetical protein